jgi:hypothetical protein
MRRRLPILVCLLLAACSASTKHVAVVADTALYETLNTIHQAEQTALCGLPSCADVANPPTVPGWTLAKSQAFNRALLPAVAAGQEFNTILSTWQVGTPLPDRARALVASLPQALNRIVQDFPEGEARERIVIAIGKAQAIVLQVLNVVLAVKG